MAENIFNDSNLENLRESIDLSRLLSDNARELVKLNKEGAGEIYGLYTQAKAASNALLKSLDKLSVNYARYQKFEVKSKEVKTDITRLDKNILLLKERQLALTKKEAEVSALALKAERIEIEAYEKKRTTSISADNRKSVVKRHQVAIERLKGLKAQSQILSGSLDLTKEILITSEQQVDNLKEYDRTAGKVEGRLAQIKGILTFTSKIPIFGRFIDVEKGMKKVEESNVLKEGFWASLGKGIGGAFESISKATVVLALVGAVYKIFDFIKDAMFGADKQITEIANKMGITKKEAQGIREQIIGISKVGENEVLLREEVYKTWLLTNEQLGIAVKLNSEFLQDISMIKNRIGLSDDAMKGLTLSTGAGEKIASDMVGQIAATNNLQKLQGKTIIDNKTLLEKTFKVVGYLRAAFQGNTSELAKSVAQAHMLGTNIEKVNSIADGFLNFESSISAELESQLLTGRNINLDQARYFALTNNISGLMSEIHDNFPSWKEFNSQNRIAAEAQAKAFGMSKDEMSDMIYEQETLNKLKNSNITNSLKGVDLEKFKNMSSSKQAFEFLKIRNLYQSEYLNLLDDEAYKRLQSISAEEKFNKAIDKLKETFSNIFTGEFVDKLGDIFVGFANAINAGSTSFNDISTEITRQRVQREAQNIKFDKDIENRVGKTLKEYPQHKDFINAVAIEEQKTRNKSITVTQPAQDFISRGSQITHFRKDDLVVGGTNLMNGSPEQLKELKELNNNIKTLIEVAKNGRIDMDGYEVGKVTSLGTYKVQ